MCSQRRAFTMVELLVAVAVIVLLIAILVPALGKVRERSRRAVCLSNLKEIGAQYVAYANDFKDQAPMGYSSTTKQFNYVLNINDMGSGNQWRIYYGIMAPFYIGGYMNTGNAKAFYCPSNTFTGHIFANVDRNNGGNNNPWPPVRTVVTANGGYLKSTTRLGYGCRPAFDFDMGEGSAPDPSASCLYFMPWPIGSNGLPKRFPALYDLKNTAIFADIVSEPVRVDGVHKNGVNVLYGDASADWVDRKKFNSNLSSVNTSNGFVSGNNNYMLNDADPNPARWIGVWADLDKR